MSVKQIEQYLAGHGLRLRGIAALRTKEKEDYNFDTSAIVLVGNIGSSFWSSFSQSAEFFDAEADPLDRWSKRIAQAVEQEFDVTALYPFEGPPYYPFLQWARRAESLQQSPLGIMIHPQYGLWHAYRFALLLNEAIEKRTVISESPCQTCTHKPCLTSCPIQAFSEHGYDESSCAGYLKSHPDADCHQAGCLARYACPVGEKYRYKPQQSQFHLRTFMAER